jgi:hypothetical protein
MLARLIEALAPYLSQTQCDVALDQIDPTAGFLGSSARALASLAPYLNAAQLGRAFELLVQLQEEDGFEYGLFDADQALCARLLALPLQPAMAIWQAALPGFAQQPRRLFVQHAFRFADLFERLGGRGTVERFVRDLTEAFERWR